MKPPRALLWAAAALLALGLWFAAASGPAVERSSQSPAVGPKTSVPPQAPADLAEPPPAVPERVEVAAEEATPVEWFGNSPWPRSLGPGTDGPERPRLDLTASLRLRLVDAQGRPLAGRSVEARTWGGYRQGKESLVADAHGRVELLLGEFATRPRHAEFVLADSQAGGAALRSSVLQLGPDGEFGLLHGRVDGGDVVLGEPALLAAGQVVGAFDAPIEGAFLELVPRGSRAKPRLKAPPGAAWAKSDANGQFEIRALAARGPLDLIASVSGFGPRTPLPVALGQTDIRVELGDMALLRVDLVLANWMQSADFVAHFAAPGLDAIPLQRWMGPNRFLRFTSDNLPAVDGQVVVSWSDYAEECLRFAAPLQQHAALGTAFVPPPLEMESHVQSFELTVRTPLGDRARDARARVWSSSGPGRTYAVGGMRPRLPRLRGPSHVVVEAPGFSRESADVVGERVVVELQSGALVVVRPPPIGVGEDTLVQWHFESLDPDALHLSVVTRAQLASEPVEVVLGMPGSYRVRATLPGSEWPEWEAHLQWTDPRGRTAVFLEDRDGTWRNFLDEVTDHLGELSFDEVFGRR